jgi:hypothetical protein
MHTLIEHQRLQLLQTENQLRVKGIEDMDVVLSPYGLTEGPIPRLDVDIPPILDRVGEAPVCRFGTFAAHKSPIAVNVEPGFAHMMAVHPTDAFAPADVQQEQAPSSESHEHKQHHPGTDDVDGLASAATMRPSAPPSRGLSVNANRMQLQTLLRRTREQSGDMQVYISEKVQLLQEERAPSQPALLHMGQHRLRAPPVPCNLRPLADIRMTPSSTDSGFGAALQEGLHPLSSEFELTSASSL